MKFVKERSEIGSPSAHRPEADLQGSNARNCEGEESRSKGLEGGRGGRKGAGVGRREKGMEGENSVAYTARLAERRKNCS